MSGNDNSILKSISSLVLKNKKTSMVVLLVILLYFFVVVTFKSIPNTPQKKTDPEQYSYLYLMQYLAGYRESERDFEIKDFKFGADFIAFTLDIQFRPKTEFEIKKLATDMVLGLTDEYPELDLVEIEVLRDKGDGAIAMYGTAVYTGSTNHITWKFQ
ncbi:MAG: hypothetical protein GY853_04935 [PVC group bacterium]|nr:hypothetical protein [PVC group bacterium]